MAVFKITPGESPYPQVQVRVCKRCINGWSDESLTSSHPNTLATRPTSTLCPPQSPPYKRSPGWIHGRGNPSASPRATPTQTRPLAKKVPKWDIERAIRALKDDTEIPGERSELALKKVPELKGRLADEGEFDANVKRKGEQELVELLKSMANDEVPWEQLFDHEVLFKPMPGPRRVMPWRSKSNHDRDRMTATERARDFKIQGNANIVLRKTIPRFPQQGQNSLCKTHQHHKFIWD
ncbi:hypothetical protein V8E52_009614 [Russula decolorans]